MNIALVGASGAAVQTDMPKSRKTRVIMYIGDK
jgi:hypothetical protein